MVNTNYDVIVVGAGPGGSAAAKKCAEKGMKVLLLEKEGLPRDKVCTGLLASLFAQELVANEFGTLPHEVTVFPHWEDGFMLHIPGAPDTPVGGRMPITWRRELDFWMNQKVKAVGGEIRDGSKVESINVIPRGYELTLTRNGQSEKVAARFVIGADGSKSIVRSCIFPNLKTSYAHCYRECYQGADLQVSSNYIHVFFLPELAPYYFDAYHKADMVLVEVTCRVGDSIKDLMVKARDFLARRYGLHIRGEVKKEACTEPILFKELLSGSLVPAKGNVLLVGDAAGLQMPITAEGIANAVQSGLVAVEAIYKASQNGGEASTYYQAGISGAVASLAQAYGWSKKIREAKSPQALTEALRSAWESGLEVRF